MKNIFCIKLKIISVRLTCVRSRTLRFRRLFSWVLKTLKCFSILGFYKPNRHLQYATKLLSLLPPITPDPNTVPADLSRKYPESGMISPMLTIWCLAASFSAAEDPPGKYLQCLQKIFPSPGHLAHGRRSPARRGWWRGW